MAQKAGSKFARAADASKIDGPYHRHRLGTAARVNYTADYYFFTAK
jgi:hypothetical protein